MKEKSAAGAEARPTGASPSSRLNIFARTNRGLLLDIVIFVANLFLMRSLTRLFRDIFLRASGTDRPAQLIIGLTALAMFTLPAAGAVLKRWRFHHRLAAQGKTVESERSALAGCVCNPIFYFCVNILIMSAVLAVFGEQIFGEDLTNNGARFVPLLFAGLGLTIFQTFLVYRYFSPPRKAPKLAFLLTPQSETLGDVCIFLNMILFQVMWNLLTYAPLRRVSGFEEFAGRLFFLCFAAMLFYFPPRIFYLAEDIRRRRTWLTMLLANSPVIVRVLIGTGSS
ncbi:MAG TPA: hypothetical protein VGC91_13045 [Pyrinomonadaceae bacterium]